MFLLKRPEKDIKVSAKVLRNASFLALYCCGNQSQRSLLYLARFSRYKHFCVFQKKKKIKNVRYIRREKNILKIGMLTLQRYPAGPKFC